MHKLLVTAAAFGGMLLVGAVDYASGVEYRVFPLYFAPLSLAAWSLGRSGAVLAAAMAAVCWLAANYFAGLRFSHIFVWIVNFTTQAVAFLTVALLIASVRRALERERVLSRTDSLTQLLNARAFYEDAARVLALARRHRHPVTLAYIDLDDFKKVNDSLGHAGGDHVLRRVADTFTRSVRATDLIARLGGDEFAMLLPQTDGDGAKAMLERVRFDVETTFAHSQPPVTASIGAMSFDDPPATIEDVVRQADLLMYKVKLSGKNRVSLERAEPSSTQSARSTPAHRRHG